MAQGNGNAVALQVQGLRKAFGGLKAVDGVDLQVRKGAFHALIGPNGAGKSTLFNLITGQLRPDEGAVFFEGRRVDRLPPYRIVRMGIGRTFQVASFFRAMTVLENVQVALFTHFQRHLNLLAMFSNAHQAMREEAIHLLEMVGLRDQAHRPSGVLAYGDQKRLELAIALSARPRLLLLDEPTAGLAPHERRETMALVDRIAREQGITVLFTEHDMDVVFGFADRITVMHQGRVLAEGLPEAVRANEEVQRIYLGEHA